MPGGSGRGPRAVGPSHYRRPGQPPPTAPLGARGTPQADQPNKQQGPGAGRLAAKAAATRTKPACAGWPWSLRGGWGRSPPVGASRPLPL